MFVTTRDGAKIYYEDHGRGRPIVLVHGWACSTRFWQRNVPVLAEEFRVVTIDLRGHGNSAKVLSGHNMPQYAQDVRTVIEQLDLTGVTLAGWSMGGPVVLAYWQQYAADGRLKGLGLVDTAPSPLSPADWNSHGLKNNNLAGMHAVFAAVQADRSQQATGFVNNMFKGGRAPAADLAWMVPEVFKTPAWIAIAAYSDFLLSDYATVLPTVKVPAIVFAADSNVYKQGIAMGRHLAAQLPQATFVPFEDGGHTLFYEQPDKFNKALGTFMRGLE
jgi:non-heme chloroperoxidase